MTEAFRWGDKRLLRAFLPRFGRLLFMLALLCVRSPADSTNDGGRDVSVELFSTRRLKAVTINPLRTNAWFADCATCAHRPLNAPMLVTGQQEVVAGGTLQLTDQGSGEEKNATGLWHLRSNGGEVDVVLTMPSEQYVAAVLNAESSVGEPQESLRALAIVARTYALHGGHFTAAPGHLRAELCDSTRCQAMRLGKSSPAIEEAVRATAGETLWFQGGRAEAFFSEHCGGISEDGLAAWPQLRSAPYLPRHADPYCVRRTTAHWHAEITSTELAFIAASQGWHFPAPIAAVQLSNRDRAHRVHKITLVSLDGQTLALDAAAFRLAVGRALGWNRLRSDNYEVVSSNGALLFDGQGYGHGVGLCQTGAAEMAAERKSAREILQFYFPGTAVRVAIHDEGWNAVRLSSLDLRSIQVMSESLETDIDQAWREARRRFALRRDLRPEITIAPSTELFRQLTSQPGWMLASTTGERIVLQPLAIVKKQAGSLRQTLLHEMMHVLVEDAAGDQVPLWLREGLVAELAGDRTSAPPAPTPLDELDLSLLHPRSHAAAERAHSAAAARVRLLVARYGLSKVRDWLISGVPAGAC